MCASFLVFLVDEAAAKYIASVKGASASKPCLECRNCLGRIDPADVLPPYQHYTSPGLVGFQQHTYETFCQDLDYLAGKHAELGNNNDFAFIEQSLGIRYDPDSLPYSDMREEARIPESRYPDWMHNLVASGGVCQYHASCMALALADNGISLEALDRFQAGLTYPRSECKLRETFFQDRVVQSGTRTAAMRAFTSDSLAPQNNLNYKFSSVERKSIMSRTSFDVYLSI